ncbi:hypothetical protein NKI94_08135 [Mesorhizobium australicum]|uniref:hypothetical protein n=1 Tax=Mesorhizobium australicum TaxID=536018 RepID=UPI0033369733
MARSKQAFELREDRKPKSKITVATIEVCGQRAVARSSGSFRSVDSDSGSRRFFRIGEVAQRQNFTLW